MTDKTLVVIFLRGGADGLSIVSPSGDKDYVAARPLPVRVARNGENPGHVIKNAAADVDFRFHHLAKDFAELYGAGELAVIHAAGLRDATRSHFDAEDRMERASSTTSSGGWLGRWLGAAKPDGILPALAVGSSAPDSLRGSFGIAVADTLNGLRAAPGHGWSNAIRSLLMSRLGDDQVLGASTQKLLLLSKAIEARVALDKDGNLKTYVPSLDYPADNPVADALKTVAQTIKLDLGLRVATVDFGGWDTHVDQAGQINNQIRLLSSGVMAFWRDLGKLQEQVSVVVMSEFGRRLKSNSSGGTDHGHGNLMMALGADVKGGNMFGKWPGLGHDALDQGADLAITTDYRTVLAEIMAGHMGFHDSKILFPGFESAKLGLMT
jgi:uncharacterized protein (DUF1501 family)